MEDGQGDKGVISSETTLDGANAELFHWKQCGGGWAGQQQGLLVGNNGGWGQTLSCFQ